LDANLLKVAIVAVQSEQAGEDDRRYLELLSREPVHELRELLSTSGLVDVHRCRRQSDRSPEGLGRHEGRHQERLVGRLWASPWVVHWIQQPLA
jgi:hypothetical protein